MPGRRTEDRRIQRTQELLREALFSLIHEKDYDRIVVKEILHRANVGRSTFYAHFRDKDELLVSGIRHLLRSDRPVELQSSPTRCDRALWFSLPIFEHIGRHRTAEGAGMESRYSTLHAHLQDMLAELIADDVRSDLLLRYLTSTFVLVLAWWAETRSSLSPKEVNDVFRALVLPALAADTPIH